MSFDFTQSLGFNLINFSSIVIYFILTNKMENTELEL